MVPERRAGSTRHHHLFREMINCEQADGKSQRGGGYHQFLKRRKNRVERRKAKRDPEAAPTYRRYAGWET